MALLFYFYQFLWYISCSVHWLNRRITLKAALPTTSAPDLAFLFSISSIYTNWKVGRGDTEQLYFWEQINLQLLHNLNQSFSDYYLSTQTKKKEGRMLLLKPKMFMIKKYNKCGRTLPFVPAWGAVWQIELNFWGVNIRKSKQNRLKLFQWGCR